MKLLLFLLFALCGQILAYELDGRVTKVSDGDTFLLITPADVPHKIRLLHIDSPERGKPYYKKAKLMLKELIGGKTVKAKCTWLDSFNRHLCDVYLGNLYINREMIARGGAWLHPKYYDFTKDPAQLIVVQEKAQYEKSGLWH